MTAENDTCDARTAELCEERLYPAQMQNLHRKTLSGDPEKENTQASFTFDPA
jgi:hypothetical protein